MFWQYVIYYIKRSERYYCIKLVRHYQIIIKQKSFAGGSGKTVIARNRPQISAIFRNPQKTAKRCGNCPQKTRKMRKIAKNFRKIRKNCGKFRYFP